MALKVIGAGLGRTGTLSLKLALEQLGFARCHHMAEVFAAPESARLWVEAAQGRPDWDAIYDGFAASVDFPGCAFWRELADHYPEAKVLLSVRDPDGWFDSTQATIFSEPMREMTDSSPMAEFFERVVYPRFGDRIHDRAFMTDYFRRWNAEVEATVPADRLLVYEVSQGWEPLCAFLGVPVPEKPFPRANSREELAAAMEALRQEGGIEAIGERVRGAGGAQRRSA